MLFFLIRRKSGIKTRNVHYIAIGVFFCRVAVLSLVLSRNFPFRKFSFRKFSFRNLLLPFAEYDKPIKPLFAFLNLVITMSLKHFSEMKKLYQL